MATRRWVVLSVVVLLGGLFWANARFVQLALESEPGCVAHDAGDSGDTRAFRAAKSSC